MCFVSVCTWREEDETRSRKWLTTFKRQRNSKIMWQCPKLNEKLFVMQSLFRFHAPSIKMSHYMRMKQFVVKKNWQYMDRRICFDVEFLLALFFLATQRTYTFELKMNMNMPPQHDFIYLCAIIAKNHHAN